MVAVRRELTCSLACSNTIFNTAATGNGRMRPEAQAALRCNCATLNSALNCELANIQSQFTKKKFTLKKITIHAHFLGEERNTRNFHHRGI